MVGRKRRRRRASENEAPGSLVLLLLVLSLLLRESSSSSSAPSWRRRKLAIELSEEPLFVCPSCKDGLQKQQHDVLAALRQLFADVQLVDRSTRLVNVLFVDLLDNDLQQHMSSTSDDVNNDRILQIPGVVEVYPSEDWQTTEEQQQKRPDAYATPLRRIGLDDAQRLCASGRGVTVAILDSGIDYTHTILGGAGTQQAYQNAYGAAYFDAKNQHRDGLFPTARVAEGIDFIGDKLRDGDPTTWAAPDDDPIDASGHGTAVAHAVRSVAPEAQLVAVKICTTTGSACPDFAFVKGLEYVLDPNNDGDTKDAVDIVNISLGRPFASSYYSLIGKLVERVSALGVLPVLAAGNSGNTPFILGGAPGTPNALTVGSTLVYDEGHDDANQHPPTIAYFSSRGPVESNGVKPDVVAPGGPFALAAAGTGDNFKIFLGTSFSAPLVAGAAALVKQKCPACSPFAVKALLMNYANHGVRYYEGRDQLSPVSLQGSGEIHLQRTLAAEFWVYCIEDMNPSIGLGTVNVAADMKFKRRLRIVKMSDDSDLNLSLSYSLRSNIHSAALSVTFSTTEVSLSGKCKDDVIVDVEFHIHASASPRNRMYSGGSHGMDPNNLDWNELDGWIELSRQGSVAEENERIAAVPFHMILRRASKVTLNTTKFRPNSLRINALPTNLTVGLQNHGSDTAQIDGYELIYFSTDDPESNHGVGNPPADLRYVGYRTLKTDSKTVDGIVCPVLVEFAIQTWERQLSLSNTHFNLWFDTDLDNLPDHSIYNSAYRLGSEHSEIKRRNLMDGSETCVGYPPDHATNSAVSILRFCLSDIGMPETGGFVNVALSSYSFPQESFSDEMSLRRISLPEPGFSMPSYDVEPGATLKHIEVSGTGLTPEGITPLGLLLVNTAYRSSTRTGSAIHGSETSVIVDERILLPEESTPDLLDFPVASDPSGSDCAWKMVDLTCPDRNLAERLDLAVPRNISSQLLRENLIDLERKMQGETCPELEVPRAQAILIRSSNRESTLDDNTVMPNKEYSSFPEQTGMDSIRQYRNVSEIPPLTVVEWGTVESSAPGSCLTLGCFLLLLLIWGL